MKNFVACLECNTQYDIPYLRCPKCNQLISTPPVKGPKRNAIKLSSMWSFESFLPKFNNRITLHEGNTPICNIRNFPSLHDLQVKLEFRNPTGTFRDRACSLIATDMIQRGKKKITNASTGSFSISMAAYAAQAQTQATTVVPENIELSKIEQMELYGANVIRKGNTLEEAMVYADSLINPKKDYLPIPKDNLLTILGQKTIGLEIAWQNPEIENIVIPQGSGTLIVSIYQGLCDALKSGWITELPRIYGVSLENARDAHLAESLVMKTPMLQDEVNRIIEITEGTLIEISAQQMIEDAMELAKMEGLFIEPASASVISAAKSLFSEGELAKSKTLAILSGTGLNTMNVFASRLRGVKKVVWGISKTSTSRFEILNLIGEQKATYAPAIKDLLSQNQTIQSIYQHLSNLENEELIVDKFPEKKRKNYVLTAKGIQVLEAMREMLDLQ